MATLNELLALVADHGADSLQLRADQPPVLFVGREPRPLSSEPPTTGETLTLMTQQLLTAAQRQALERDGKVDAEYRPPRLGLFDLRVRLLPTGLALGFRPRGDAAPAPADVARTETSWPVHGIAALLEAAVARGASDVVVSEETEVTVREGGELRPLPGAVFDRNDLLDALAPVLTQRRRDELEARGSTDLAFELPATEARGPARFRVNLFRQRAGLAAVFRPIWEKVPTFADLHLPPEVATLTDYPYGLVLVTGPTGMGKSTTLSAMLEHLNSTRSLHVITLEDPIEYLFRRKKCLIHQRELGVHVDSFAGGLRAALRESPDVIFVGEMRDQDTIAAALTAAETGHLVLSTLHSGSPAQAIDRIIDMFPENQQAQVRLQLADVTRAIVAQRLLPGSDGRSRVPVLELVRVNYAFSHLIRDRKTHLFPSQIQSSRQEGTIAFDESLARAVRGGRVAVEEAMRVCRDPTHFKLLLNAEG